MEIQIVDDTASCRRDSSFPTVSTSVCARPWCIADAFCCRQLCLCATLKTKKKKKKRRRTTTRCVACSNAEATGKTKSSYLFIYLFWEQGGGGILNGKEQQFFSSQRFGS